MAIFTPRKPSRPEGMLDWRGWAVRGSRGEMIGKIEEIYVGEETAAPDWALVRGDGPGAATSFLPLHGSRSEAHEVIVPFTRREVARAPQIQFGSQLSPEQGAALYDHYGISDSVPDEAPRDSAWEIVVAVEQKLSAQLSRAWERWLSNVRGRQDTTRDASAADRRPTRSTQRKPPQGERDEDPRER